MDGKISIGVVSVIRYSVFCDLFIFFLFIKCSGIIISRIM